MADIRTFKVAVTTTGTTDAATGSTTTKPVFGYLLDMYLDYSASISGAATDVTLAYAAGLTGEETGSQVEKVAVPARGNILVVSNNKTDGLYAPRQTYYDAAGASQGALVLYPLDGPLTVSVAGSDALTDCVIAYIRYMTV